MIGEEIRRLRKEKGMTLKQLANKIDLSQTYLSQIELGDRNVSLEMLSKLESVFKVSKLHLYKVAGLLDETDILTLLDENKRLRKALEYYADTKHYEPYCIAVGDYASDVTEDNGEIARKVLEGGD